MAKVVFDKSSVKDFLIHSLPVLVVWGGLGFYTDRASLALVGTNMLTACLDFVRDW